MHHRIRKNLYYLLVCSFVLSAGCAPSPYPHSFRVEMNALDLSTLQGRTVVIDPGHGGRFIGAVGSQGLRESDINLAVGLYLWGLLHQAGAKAWLTRSADVDLCPRESPNLEEDLYARSHVSNNLKADLFISIHHNSDINDRKKNNTQVYYKLTDPGASQDLARSVARELRAGQFIPEVFVFPGNYRVLRNTEAVAILGEASFITNRNNETRLSLSNQLRREAEDYFLGILTYFHKGIPEIVDYYPAETTVISTRPQIKARIIGELGGEAIDPKNARLYLDGVLVPATFNPQTGIITYIPEKPLKNCEHTYYVEARNLNGNANWKRPVHFLVSFPPSSLQVSSAFSSLPAGGASSSRIEVVSRDTYGNPVIDGTLIALNTTAGRLEKEVVTTVDGCATTYFASPNEPDAVTIEARYQSIIAQTTIRCGPVEDALARLTIEDQRHQPLANVRVHAGQAILGISDASGLVFIRHSTSEKCPITLKRSGYVPKKEVLVFEKGVFRRERFALLPREEGLLLGKKFTLDAEPWDSDSEREFGLGADGEQANIFVVEKLQGLLQRAGAQVTVTRTDHSQRPTPGDRVLVGENFAGDYFITLTHRKGNPHVGHYFRSETGKEVAQTVAQFLKQEVPLGKMIAYDVAEFTVIHPRSPSIVINFGNRHLPKRGDRRQDILKKEARGVYEGLVTYLKKTKSGNRDL